ncbi:MAG TPA: class II aldolase/adducin family protein [Kiritimatiellia bacterium]|nr:class II aldolase/adducin family protein [Kiritimatiellia bacterium]
MNGLATITALSREFGTPDYVLGGGGNTSVKTAETLWIKPSGTQLNEMTPERFVAIDRKRLAALYAYPPAADAAVRENDVKELMLAARVDPNGGRPSVETPLHDMLEAKFVVHTHPAWVNGLTCGMTGEAAARRLFPDALWVPYIDPGFTLSMDVKARVANYRKQHGAHPAVILLENHGIFVAGDSAEAIRGHYAAVMTALRAEYHRSGVSLELKYRSPTIEHEVKDVSAILADLFEGDTLAVAASAPFATADGPLTPDHMVYAKAFPYRGALTREGFAAYRSERGYLPRIIDTPEGVFAVRNTVTAAELSLALARDGGLVRQLAAAFGGVRYLDDAARRFIESWEVESYREQQAIARG